MGYLYFITMQILSTFASLLSLSLLATEVLAAHSLVKRVTQDNLAHGYVLGVDYLYAPLLTF